MRKGCSDYEHFRDEASVDLTCTVATCSGNVMSTDIHSVNLELFELTVNEFDSGC
jgi:hypothetical protein